MASIRQIASDFLPEFRDGIQWVAVWKQGRSWKAEAILSADYYEPTGEVSTDEEDRKRMQEILEEDPSAVILNGFYCNCGGNEITMTIKSLMEALEWQYTRCSNYLKDFLESAQHHAEEAARREAEQEAQDAGEKMIRVLRKYPGEAWEVTQIPYILKAFQQEVDGYIESCTIGRGLTIICNEEGRLLDLPPNGFLDFVGTILAVGVDGAEFTDISDDAVAFFTGEQCR